MVFARFLVLFLCSPACVATVIGSCGSDQPSKVGDCQNVDMGSCGNACCKLLVAVGTDPEDAMKTLNKSLSHGGPDGFYTLQSTAGGNLGFDDLRKYKIPNGVEFVGQVHHMTSGAKHYNDTIDFNIRPCKPNIKGCGREERGALITAFSLSLIAGALGDNGQNYKNIMMAIKGAFPSDGGFISEHADSSCPAASKIMV